MQKMEKYLTITKRRVRDDSEKERSLELLEPEKKKCKAKGPLKIDECFEKLDNKGRKNVRCKICYKHPEIVKLYSGNKIYAVASEEGTAPRKELLDTHLSSEVHKQCLSAEIVKNLNSVEKEQKLTFHRLIAKQNIELAKKVAKFICTVYNDAKHGTLSAWSWPSREVAYLKGLAVDLNSENYKPFIPREGELQYINPSGHREFLESIVHADLGNLKKKLDNCLAISLRLDGSVDRTQVDNIHVLAKIITDSGDAELIFLGFSELTKRGAEGYYEAAKNAVNYTFNWKTLLQEVSSVVSDGAKINVGEKNGFWTLLENDKIQDESTGPLIKIWCVVHRSALAWNGLTKEKFKISEVESLISTCVSIVGYFHQSGLRTKELKDLATKYGKQFLQFPKYFEVRWTEFSYNLLQSVLKNYFSLVKFFEEKVKLEKDNVAEGYLHFLKNFDKVKLLCFLTDLAFVFSRLQKSVQGDGVSIFDVQHHAEEFLINLKALESTCLLGGWEEQFNSDLTCETASSDKTENSDALEEEEHKSMEKEVVSTKKSGSNRKEVGSNKKRGRPKKSGVKKVPAKKKKYIVEKDDKSNDLCENYILHGIILTKDKAKRRKIHHLYINEFRNFETVRNETIQTLSNFFKERTDMPFIGDLKILQFFDKNAAAEDIRKCHRMICPDYPLLAFATSYKEAASSEALAGKSITDKCVLKSVLKVKTWNSLAVAIARIIAATPHSADVERLISFYNILKTSGRSSLSSETIKEDLYIKINMPTVSEFNPHPATIYWLNKKDRHSKPHPKAMYQEYYSGVFPESKSESQRGYTYNVGF